MVAGWLAGFQLKMDWKEAAVFLSLHSQRRQASPEQTAEKI